MTDKTVKWIKLHKKISLWFWIVEELLNKTPKV